MESGFFKNIPYEDAQAIEQASRLLFELRENRAALLRAAGVDDEAELLAGIAEARLPEHPNYERYLSACILDATREALRRDLAAHLAANHGAQPLTGAGEVAPPPLMTPPELKECLQALYDERLDGEILAAQDAVLLRLDNGVALELRVLSADEYAFGWLWGEAALCIDTAPVARAPSHLHGPDGQVRPDTVTVPGRDPLSNIQSLIDAILRDPMLGG